LRAFARFFASKTPIFAYLQHKTAILKKFQNFRKKVLTFALKGGIINKLSRTKQFARRQGA